MKVTDSCPADRGGVARGGGGSPRRDGDAEASPCGSADRSRQARPGKTHRFKNDYGRSGRVGPHLRGVMRGPACKTLAALNADGSLRYLGFAPPNVDVYRVGPRSTAVGMVYLYSTLVELPPALRTALLDRIDHHPSIADLATLIRQTAETEADATPFD